MILYDKECNLLGMSKGVLDFLGHEDLEEFKAFTNDVADLFEQRSGYVYRFKNFSWIHYILHSGAPNKNAILHLKNGKEVEVRILIEEILLLDSTKNGSYYKVDFQPAKGYQPNNFSLDNSVKSAPPTSQELAIDPLPESKDFLPQEPQFEEPIFSINETFDTHEEKNQPKPDDSGVSFMNPSEFDISYDSKPKDYEAPLPVNFNQPDEQQIFLKQDDIQFSKIDFDDDLDTPNDFETKISIAPQDEDLAIHNEPQESDPIANIPSPEDFNQIEYDPQETLDALGLEPNELKLFIHEYCDNIEMVSIALEDAMNDHDTEGKRALLMQLRGTCQHLRLHHVASLLEKLYHSDDIETLRALQEYALKLKNMPIGN